MDQRVSSGRRYVAAAFIFGLATLVAGSVWAAKQMSHSAPLTMPVSILDLITGLLADEDSVSLAAATT